MDQTTRSNSNSFTYIFHLQNLRIKMQIQQFSSRQVLVFPALLRTLLLGIAILESS